jgi:hypothetical protein
MKLKKNSANMAIQGTAKAAHDLFVRYYTGEPKMKCAACIAILGLFVVASTSGYSDKQLKTLPSMAAPSITHGNTRITLIHMSRITSWSNQFVHGHDDQQGPVYAIPGVYLQFVVEIVDEGLIKPGFNSSTIKLYQNGRLILPSSPVIGGGENGEEQYSLKKQQFGFKRPAVNDKSKTYIMWDYARGISLESGKVMISFKAGFDQDNHIFEFRDIPLY